MKPKLGEHPQAADALRTALDSGCSYRATTGAPPRRGGPGTPLPLRARRVLAEQGETTEAMTCLHRAAMLHRRLGDHSREAAALDATGEACQRAHRFAEAIGFHRVAAATFGELDDRWQLALSLEHLATALAASDGEHGEESSSHAEVTTSRAEAADMLRRFTDPLARRIHARLTS